MQKSQHQLHKEAPKSFRVSNGDGHARFTNPAYTDLADSLKYTGFKSIHPSPPSTLPRPSLLSTKRPLFGQPWRVPTDRCHFERCLTALLTDSPPSPGPSHALSPNLPGSGCAGKTEAEFHDRTWSWRGHLPTQEHTPSFRPETVFKKTLNPLFPASSPPSPPRRAAAPAATPPLPSPGRSLPPPPGPGAGQGDAGSGEQRSRVTQAGEGATRPAAGVSPAARRSDRGRREGQPAAPESKPRPAGRPCSRTARSHRWGGREGGTARPGPAQAAAWGGGRARAERRVTTRVRARVPAGKGRAGPGRPTPHSPWCGSPPRPTPAPRATSTSRPGPRPCHVTLQPAAPRPRRRTWPPPFRLPAAAARSAPAEGRPRGRARLRRWRRMRGAARREAAA